MGGSVNERQVGKKEREENFLERAGYKKHFKIRHFLTSLPLLSLLAMGKFVFTKELKGVDAVSAYYIFELYPF